MKKKRVISAIASILIIGLLAGCGTKRDSTGNIYNEKYNKKKMVNVKGTDVKIHDNKQVKVYKENGYGYAKPNKWKDISNSDGIDGYSEDKYVYYMMYMPEEQVKKLNSIDKSKMSKDEIKNIKEAAYNSEFYVFSIYRENSDDKESVKAVESAKKNFAKADKVAEIGKNKYYFAYNDKVSGDGFSDSDKKNIQTMIDTLKDVKNSLVLFPPVNLEEEFKSASMSEFKTKDINGKEVTEDVIKKYDLTMVNVWATWCSYCVEEMPELQSLYKKLPKNVNMITICTDGDTKAKEAKELLNKSKAEFTTLVKCDELNENVIDYITGYPTTFFVDKKGKVVGHLQVGTPSEDGKDNEKGYQQLIDQALKEVKR